MAVATWASVGDSPGYAAMVELLEEEIGDWAADALRAPFCLGTPELIGDVLRQSFEDVTVVRREGQARFTSLDDWLYTEIRGWTLAEHIDDDQYARLRRAAATRLARFVTGDGAATYALLAVIHRDVHAIEIDAVAVLLLRGAHRGAAPCRADTMSPRTR